MCVELDATIAEGWWDYNTPAQYGTVCVQLINSTGNFLFRNRTARDCFGFCSVTRRHETVFVQSLDGVGTVFAQLHKGRYGPVFVQIVDGVRTAFAQLLCC